MIYFTMTVWYVDAWNPTDYFSIKFDLNEVTSPTTQHSSFPAKTCGRYNYRDSGTVRIFGKASHSSTSSLTVRVITYTNEGPENESFGFRSLNLLFVTPDTTLSGSTTNSICGLAPTFTFTTKDCGCPEGQFQYPTSPYNCAPCDPRCASCFSTGPKACYQCAAGASYVSGQCVYCDPSCDLCSGPDPSQCTTCKAGLYLFNGYCVSQCEPPSVSTTDGCINSCSLPCTPNTNYLFWNGTCSSSCPYPLQKIMTTESVRTCVYPCATGEYLYWDGSCETSCESPLGIRIEGTAYYCDYLCSVNTFLYWDGSCISTCPPPYVQRFDRGQQFCEYPCTTNEFLHADGTCLTYCNSPFVQNTYLGKDICNTPCTTSSDYLYWDGTCQSSCPMPLKRYSIGLINYCTYTCAAGQIFAAWNRTCITFACDSPYILTSQTYVDVCSLPCSYIDNSYFYHEDTQTCSKACNVLSVMQDGLYLKCNSIITAETSGLIVDLLLIAPETTWTTTFVMISKLTQYLHYMNIAFPPRLQKLVETKSRPVLSLKIGPSMPQHLQNHFTKHSISDVYERLGLHSSFMVNFWSEMTTIWILLFSAIVFLITRHFAEKWNLPLVYKLCTGLRFIILWNYLTVLFAINTDDIVLFSALEIQTFESDSVQAAFSLVLSIVMLLCLTFFVVFTVCLSFRASEIRNRNLRRPQDSFLAYRSFIARWQGVQVLFRGYRTHGCISRSFYFIYTVRIVLQMIIATSGIDKPLMQAIFYLCISIVIFMYISCAKPIKHQVSHVQLMLVESVTLIMNTCLVALAGGSLSHDIQYDDPYVLLADIVILANVAVNFIMVFFLGVKVILGLRYAFNLMRQLSVKEHAAWFHILFLPIQQCGFGFEHAKGVDHLAVGQNNTPSEGDMSSVSMLNKKKRGNKQSRVLSDKSFVSNSTQIDHHFDMEDNLTRTNIELESTKKRGSSRNRRNPQPFEFCNMNNEIVDFNDISNLPVPPTPQRSNHSDSTTIYTSKKSLRKR